MPSPISLGLGLYQNRAGSARQVLILLPGTLTESGVIWQDPETGQCYRCTRRSFLRWQRSYRRPVPTRAPGRAFVDGQALARQLEGAAATALEAARLSELAQLRHRLTHERLTPAEANHIRQRCRVLSTTKRHPPC